MSVLDACSGRMVVIRRLDLIWPKILDSRFVAPLLARELRSRYREVSTQNSLPSGSAMTTELTVP
jgi:hypothetical protein